MSILKFIPGTHEHATRRVNWLFNDANFSSPELTGREAAVLQESEDRKYIPAVVSSQRARYFGALVGMFAPEQFLLIWAVTLAASAAATTGAWYSITLKEMKNKFEKMWLNLTWDLLKADLMANSLWMYAWIGLAHKTIAFPSIVDAIQNPTKENIIKCLFDLWLSWGIHFILKRILHFKENSSIQYDFNDATLAGMTEEQQRFFSKAISEVHNLLWKLQSPEHSTSFNRTFFWCTQALCQLVKKFDTENVHENVFKDIDLEISRQSDNYSLEFIPFIDLFVWIVKKLIWILNIDNSVQSQISNKIWLIKKLKSSNTDDPIHNNNKIVAIVSDIIPIIVQFLEQKWEKGIKPGPIDLV